jgi:hypothetical protein
MTELLVNSTVVTKSAALAQTAVASRIGMTNFLLTLPLVKPW